MYFWNGYQWQRVAEGGDPIFTIAAPKGTYRWMATDVLPDGSRTYQRAYGFWTNRAY